MLRRGLEELKQFYYNMYPILAIDYGLKHLGLAHSDDNGIIASPLPVLSITKNRDISALITEILEVCKEYRIQSILIGYPQVFTSGQVQNQKRIDAFIFKLKSVTTLPIQTWDESFSTANAKNMLISIGQHYKKNKKKIDSVAACTFLQEYLDNK